MLNFENKINKYFNFNLFLKKKIQCVKYPNDF